MVGLEVVSLITRHQEPMKNAYDEVVYPSAPLVQTHPDRLATIGTLLGMAPAEVTRCRVLELGCGTGVNLISMAFSLPHSEFLGIDLAGARIAEGQAAVEALALGNIRLDHLDLLDLTPELGRFDYIIAHGLYSWVPREVQVKLLAICHDHLAPQGVAYVSYNTYPGGHVRNMLREMMVYHLRGRSDPSGKIEEARALVRLLATPRGKPDAYQRLMTGEAEQILDHAPGHLFHDELAEINCPVYFHEFVAHAAEHHLQYLAEADYFYQLQDQTFPAAVVTELNRIAPTRLMREQYLDFLKCRRFRQTLLCHKAVDVNTDPPSTLVPRFWISSRAQPLSTSPDLASPTPERFSSQNANLETDHPLTKAALFGLSQIWPHRLSYQDLLARARSLLGGSCDSVSIPTEAQSQKLCENLLRMYCAGLVDFHLYAPACALEPGEAPVASPLARYQVQQNEIVTNLYHQPVRIEGELAKGLLRLLDGTRNRLALSQDLAAGMTNNPAFSSESARLIAAQLDHQLAQLARLGLLMA